MQDPSNLIHSRSAEYQFNVMALISQLAPSATQMLHHLRFLTQLLPTWLCTTMLELSRAVLVLQESASLEAPEGLP
jgi:hypothetical protein